ncbi:MAG TPA: lipopolysaccharide heptosyltransferase I [Burkholderiales bacterium]|nr:lipopolysaccharide heptosyltransferase I [Burkholderiales bacterium]
MPRILFVKTSSLGDVVHHCPAVSDAARALPGAAIDWVVEESFAAVAAMHRNVRRVIPVALRRWRARAWNPAVWREIGAFRRALAAERYDYVVDTQGLMKSAAIAALARGERHGLDRASAREPLAARFYHHRHRVPRALHAVERNRRLCASALGYTLQGPCDYGLVAGRPAGKAPEGAYAVLLSMTSRADKLWPEALWRELAHGLAARGLRLLLPWGSEAERARCERVAAGIGGAFVPPRMPLAELAGVLGAARCAAGIDTGLAHLAAALGVPTVGIYCGSDPELTGLYGARTKNLGRPAAPPTAAEVLEALEGLC